MTAPLLHVESLRVDIGTRRVLDDVTFTIGRGEVLGLVGPSGSGKSVTASAIIGLLPDTARATGSIRFDHTELLSLDDRRFSRFRGRHLAYVPQDPMGSLTPTRTIAAHLIEAITLHRPLSRRDAERAAVDLLRQVEIPSAATRADAYPHELSGGMRQRVAIALAVANDPELIVADEPTSALDADVGSRILDLFDGLLRERRTAMLLISHDPGVVERMSHRTLAMSHGRLIPAEPVQRPAEPRGRLELRRADEKADRHADPSLVLDVERLTVTFGRPGLLRRAPTVTACRNVHLTVAPGEAVALVGPSGSGKTTVVNQILQLRPPTHGRIAVLGQDVSALSASERRRMRTRVQTVFQDPGDSLDPRMRIESIVAEPLLVHRRPGSADRITELLDLVGLPAGTLGRYPRQLSGGQQQRVAIARALALEPELLILDEPVSSLDAPLRTSIMTLLDDLRTRFGLSYLLVSHDLALVRRHVDSIVTLARAAQPDFERSPQKEAATP